MRSTVLLALALALSATAAQARQVETALSLSTLGPGFSVSTAIVPSTLTATVGFNHYSTSRSGTYAKNGNSIPYTASAQLQSFPVLLNYYPFHGFMHLAGGIYVNQNRIDATAGGGNGSYTINGNTYTSAQVGTFTGSVRFRPVSPYLGVGFGDRVTSGFSGGLDVGVLFEGSPQVRFSASNPTGNAQLASDVAQAQATANADASKYKMYPVIGFHVGYTF